MNGSTLFTFVLLDYFKQIKVCSSNIKPSIILKCFEFFEYFQLYQKTILKCKQVNDRDKISNMITLPRGNL